MNHRMDTWVSVTFKQEPNIRVIASSGDGVAVSKQENGTYRVHIPAAGFAVLAF